MAINLTAAYVKMLYYDRIYGSKGIDVNKSKKSIKFMICRYWYFLDSGYKYEPEVCNGCHYVPLMASGLDNIGILNIKGVDYRSIIWNMNKVMQVIY